MECEITPDNARYIDKITSLSSFHMLTIQISANNLILQFIQEDKSLVCNITLTPSFFKILEIDEQTTFDIQCIKFYKPKMQSLKIKLTKYLFILKWMFPSHLYIKELCIADSNLYNLRFEPLHQIVLETYLMHEILKHYETKNVLLRYSECRMVVSGVSAKMSVETEISICSDSEGEIEVPLKNVRNVFELHDISNECVMTCDRDGVALNFVVGCVDFNVSMFLAIYS